MIAIILCLRELNKRPHLDVKLVEHKRIYMELLTFIFSLALITHILIVATVVTIIVIAKK